MMRHEFWADGSCCDYRWRGDNVCEPLKGYVGHCIIVLGVHSKGWVNFILHLQASMSRGILFRSIRPSVTHVLPTSSYESSG